MPRRLAEAQRCRPDGGAKGARGRMAILRATVAGALDRSLDVAAVLEMRGYGAARAPAPLAALRSRATTSPSRPARLRSSLLTLYASVMGLGSFSAYPLVSRCT